MTADEIILAIHKLDRDSIGPIYEAVRMRREWLSRTGIRVGDTVQFDARTRGIQTGKVIKINPTRTKVQVGMMTWNVSPELLTKVKAAVVV
jgi:hypothetical protein